MKPIKEKAWAVVWKKSNVIAIPPQNSVECECGWGIYSSHSRARAAANVSVAKETLCREVLIIDPRHFDVVAKKKGKVKRGK